MNIRFLLVGLTVALAGCAAIEQNEAAQHERWLRQAGFLVLVADTPRKQAALAGMAPYRIESKVEGDTVVYRYADPAQGRIFVGGPEQYEAYKKIAVSAKSRRASNLASITPNSVRATGPILW